MLRANKPANVVPFDPSVDRIIPIDLSSKNKSLTPEIFSDTAVFSDYISGLLAGSNARYGIGGYDELREVYGRSNVFTSKQNEEPRRLHLGTDIWGAAGTSVSSPLPALVHSFANNSSFGDYGHTIILRHDVNRSVFYTLYGHLAASSLQGLTMGQSIQQGEIFASFGHPSENGEWPPHLHFQIILDIEGWSGDYPGVCANSQKNRWLSNSPDPDFLLQLNRYMV